MSVRNQELCKQHLLKTSLACAVMPTDNGGLIVGILEQGAEVSLMDEEAVNWYVGKHKLSGPVDIIVEPPLATIGPPKN